MRPTCQSWGSMRQAARRTLSTIVRQPSTCSPDQTPGVGRKKKPIHGRRLRQAAENDRPAERRFRAAARAGALVLYQDSMIGTDHRLIAEARMRARAVARN